MSAPMKQARRHKGQSGGTEKSIKLFSLKHLFSLGAKKWGASAPASSGAMLEVA